MRAIVLVLVMLAGCATDEAPPSISTYRNPAIAGAGIGESCSDVACASGLSCVSYEGIAGSQGPVIETCEMPCRTDADCSDGRRCVDVPEGPRDVCR